MCVGRRLGRAPLTITRELRCNAATRAGRLDYRASVTQRKTDMQALRPREANLLKRQQLGEHVQERLSGHVHRPDGTPVQGPETRQ